MSEFDLWCIENKVGEWQGELENWITTHYGKNILEGEHEWQWNNAWHKLKIQIYIAM